MAVFAVMFFAVSFSAFAEWTTESLFCGMKIGMKEKDCRATLEQICKKYVTTDSLCGDTIVTQENGALTAVIYTTSAIGDLQLSKTYRCFQVTCYLKDGKLNYYVGAVTEAKKDDVTSNMATNYNYLQDSQGFSVYDGGKDQIIGIKEAPDFYQQGDGKVNVVILVNPKTK